MGLGQNGFVIRLRLAAAAGDLHWPGLVLAVLLLAALFASVLALGVLPLGPAERAYGTVLTVDVTAWDTGPRITARVRTVDGERTLSLPRGSVCWPGDRIELRRRGERYGVGLGGCARP